MDKEIWKDIEGYENYYQISNLGNIKSLPRKIINNKGYYISKEKILSAGLSASGYMHIALCRFGKNKTFKIHRLKAIAFIPNPENKPCINHIDGNKLNNDIYNLEWCTHSENHKHAFKIGLKTPHHNTDHSSNKPVNQLDLNMNFIAKYKSIHEAFRITGIDYRMISKVCTGIQKKTHGFVFEYAY